MAATAPTASRSTSQAALSRGRNLPASPQGNAPEQPVPHGPAGSASRGDDLLTAAVVFAIIGGCIALWLADLSLVTGSLAAVFSALAGLLFADW